MDQMLRRSAAEAQSGWMMKPTRNRHSAIHKASWAWGCRQRQKGMAGDSAERRRSGGEVKADDGPRRISHGVPPSQICHLYSQGERPPHQKSPGAGAD